MRVSGNEFCIEYCSMAEGVSVTESSIQTYHCLCTTLILVTPYDLAKLPVRSSSSPEQAIILPLPTSDVSDQDQKYAKSALHNVVSDRKPMIVRREDGFEKRVPLRCTRCKLVVGYKVDDDSGSSDSSTVFLLPGGFMSTENMKEGRIPQAPT